MEATLVKNKQGVIAVTDREQVEAAKRGELTVDGRKLLILRGGDTSQTVAEVYLAFCNHTDRTGIHFKFSKDKRFLVEQDPIWHQSTRVSPTSMANYVKSWFALGELLHTAVGEVIIIVTELPRMSTALWGQGRYIAQHIGLFEVIE